MRVSEHNRMMLRWGCCLTTLLTLAACGSTAASPDSAALVDDVGMDVGKDSKDASPDFVAEDVGQDIDVIDTQDVKNTDVSVDPNLCTINAKGYQPGDCGSPCSTEKLCAFPYCISTPDNNVCSKDCGGNDTQCPLGWQCIQLAEPPDVQYGCVPRSPNLGKPCQADTDCKSAVGATIGGLGDYCVSFGDAGAFCGGACDSGQLCPTHFTCQQVKRLSDSKLVQQCVTDKASLDQNCTKRYEAEGDETLCYNTVGKDRCAGKRHCDTGVLTKCDAATPTAEICNNIDDNCNGQTDEAVPGATCSVLSNNGKLKCPGKPFCAGGIETCVGQAPQTESCNGFDDDCNGKTDEGCDDDGDSYCDATMGYEPGTLTCTKGGGDCDDTKNEIHPKAPEICDGLDNDCNGFVDALDPGLPLTDPQFCANQLGVCSGAPKTISLCSGGIWQACSPTDYKKYDSSFSNAEVCDDKDNNCNGVVDEGCDDDKDGYCDSGFSTIGFPLSCPKGGGDCDDTNSKTYPGAPELCDNLDENCNGVTDEGCDKDKDGWCDANMMTFGGPNVCPGGGGDCNDGNPDIRPDAKEKCNAVDDDCNGLTDETWPDLGLPCAGGKGQCVAKGIKVCKADLSSSTCSVQPGPPQTEICDNLDNDCNGLTDEGCDDDLDGYCDANMGAIGHPYACLAGPGDCNDEDPDVHPGAKEVCDNIDNDCDDKTDADDGDMINDDPQQCETQKGVCAGTKKSPTMCKAGVWAKCDTSQYQAWNIFYSTVESCDNMDNDCNGATDEGCDADGDGFCSAAKKIVGAPAVCSTKDPYTGFVITHVNDCDDNNAADFPGNTEICDNKDNNCNGNIDEGCDKDNDGYCDANLIVIGKPTVCPMGGNDCNDDPKSGGVLINPGEPETCFDSIDNNCNGSIDENCNWYFPLASVNNPGGIDPNAIGPDYSGEGYFQCAGYQDLPYSSDIPDSGWAANCAATQWKRIRIACGQQPAAGAPGAPWPLLRAIDLNQNVFLPGALVQGLKAGAIVSTHGFPADKAATILQNNLLQIVMGSGDTGNHSLDYNYSWIGDQTGFDETHPSLIVNNPGSPWEAANCFGLALWDNYSTPNLTHKRSLLVYVGK